MPKHKTVQQLEAEFEAQKALFAEKTRAMELRKAMKEQRAAYSKLVQAERASKKAKPAAKKAKPAAKKPKKAPKKAQKVKKPKEPTQESSKA
jgi:hypothetical protein